MLLLRLRAGRTDPIRSARPGVRQRYPRGSSDLVPGLMLGSALRLMNSMDPSLGIRHGRCSVPSMWKCDEDAHTSVFLALDPELSIEVGNEFLSARERTRTVAVTEQRAGSKPHPIDGPRRA